MVLCADKPKANGAGRPAPLTSGGKMHAANVARSKRLQTFIKCLESGPKTTREIIRETGLCAINSIAAECKANGVNIKCHYRGTTPDGGRVFEYQLVRLGGSK